MVARYGEPILRPIKESSQRKNRIEYLAKKIRQQLARLSPEQRVIQAKAARKFFRTGKN
jgi:hypothetical protein